MFSNITSFEKHITTKLHRNCSLPDDFFIPQEIIQDLREQKNNKVTSAASIGGNYEKHEDSVDGGIIIFNEEEDSQSTNQDQNKTHPVIYIVDQLEHEQKIEKATLQEEQKINQPIKQESEPIKITEMVEESPLQKIEKKSTLQQQQSRQNLSARQSQILGNPLGKPQRQSSRQSSIMEKACRICLESDCDQDTGELENCCGCNGSLKFVHRECLYLQLQKKIKNMQKDDETSESEYESHGKSKQFKELICELCQQPYRVSLQINKSWASYKEFKEKAKEQKKLLIVLVILTILCMMVSALLIIATQIDTSQRFVVISTLVLYLTVFGFIASVSGVIYVCFVCAKKITLKIEKLFSDYQSYAAYRKSLFPKSQNSAPIQENEINLNIQTQANQEHHHEDIESHRNPQGQEIVVSTN